MAAARQQRVSERKLPAFTARPMARTASSTGPRGPLVSAKLTDVESRAGAEVMAGASSPMLDAFWLPSPGDLHTAYKWGKLAYDVGSSVYRSYRGRDRAPPRPRKEVRPFGVEGQKGARGGRVTRVYEMEFNIGNLAAASTSLGYGVSLRYVSGTGITLNLYAGIAISGTGTGIVSFDDFAAEAAHFCDVFKWVKIDKMEVEFIPIVTNVNEDATSGTDASVQADPGVVGVTRWTGDVFLNSGSTGVSTQDWLNWQRDPHHKLWKPVGKKILQYATKLNIVELVDSQYGQDALRYSNAPAIECANLLQQNSEFPHYGIQFYWNHPNLSANAGKYYFKAKFKVQVTWNTVKDDSLQAAATAARQQRLAEIQKLAGQPFPMSRPDQKEPIFFPKDVVGAPPEDPLPGIDTIDQLESAQRAHPSASKELAAAWEEKVKSWPKQAPPTPKEDYVKVEPTPPPQQAKPKIMSRPASPARR